MPRKPFFPLLEGMRGIAAILVMLRHIPHLALPIEFPVSGLAVDLFFVLSGVVIANSYEDKLASGKMGFAAFVGARVLRIYPLYLIGSAIGLAALIALSGLAAWQLATISVLGLLMLPSPVRGAPMFAANFPGWSLFFELLANFAYARFIRLASNRNLAIVVALSWLVLVGWSARTGVSLDMFGWERRSAPLGVARVSASFFGGVLIYRLAIPRLARVRFGNPAALLIIAVTALALVAPVSPSLAWPVSVAITLIAFPLLVLGAVFVHPGPMIDRACRVLGEISFPLYVLHEPLYRLIDHFLLGKRLSPLAPWAGLAFVALLSVFAVLINRHVDAPLRQWLGQGLRQRQAAAA